MESQNRIMLIDDDPICQLISTRILQMFSSYATETFTDPTEALKEISLRVENERNRLPLFILLDINMPVMNGWHFLDEFEKNHPEILAQTCVIMLTSSTHSADKDMAKRYKSVREFLSKPLTEAKVRQIEEICKVCATNALR